MLLSVSGKKVSGRESFVENMCQTPDTQYFPDIWDIFHFLFICQKLCINNQNLNCLCQAYPLRKSCMTEKFKEEGGHQKIFSEALRPLKTSVSYKTSLEGMLDKGN